MNNLERLRKIVNDYKNPTIKIFYSFIVVLLILSQLIGSLKDFLEQNDLIGNALLLSMMLLIFDALTSKQASRNSDNHITLDHFSDLKPYLKKGFEKTHVKIEIVAYSGETFYSLFTDVFKKMITSSNRPAKSIDLKILIPNCEIPMGVPCRTDNFKEDINFKQTIIDRGAHFVQEFNDYFEKILEKAPEIKVDFQVKRHRMSPLFKQININDEILFFSVYPISKTTFKSKNEKLQVWDFRGVDSSFVGIRKNGSLIEKKMFQDLDYWFNNTWSGISEKYEIFEV